jgi:hypothetical protein
MPPLIKKLKSFRERRATSRKTINKRVTQLDNATKESKSNRWMQDGNIMGSVDYNSEKRIYDARQKLEKAVKQRRKNSLALRISKLSPQTREKLDNINQLRESRRHMQTLKNRGITMVRFHPKLRGLISGDLIQAIDRNGVIRQGEIVNATSKTLFIQENNNAYPTPLPIEQLKLRKLEKK